MDMVSSGYNYYSSPYYSQQQSAAAHYYNYYWPQQRASWGGWQSSSSSSVPVFLLLATASLLVVAALVALCGSAVESLAHQLRGFLVLSPVLVVIAVQLWVASGGGLGSLLVELVTGDRREEQYYSYDQYQYPYPYRGGAAGSSPWGVALALVLVLFLVSYQSWIHETWFGWFGLVTLIVFVRTRLICQH